MCAMCLCVDSFGLGWAYDAFLHVTCSRISHAYALSFQYIWYYWCCLRLFWLFFLFLPLFLFTLVVSMTPKRKSTPARKPFRSGASSSSIPGGSIENAPASSIASRHLVDRSSFCSWIWFLVARYFLDTSAVDKHFLDTYLDSFLDTSRYLICRALLKVLIKPPRVIRSSFHLISLSIALCFLSQTLSSHSNLNPQRFLQAFSSFSSLGKLLISHSSCISCFET